MDVDWLKQNRLRYVGLRKYCRIDGIMIQYPLTMQEVEVLIPGRVIPNSCTLIMDEIMT